MPINSLMKYLDDQNVHYITISHSKAYTAQQVAQSAHISGKELAKIVIVKLDGELAMAVLPAAHRLDLDAVKTASGAEAVELATEDEFRGAFPGCEVGAMPPFGHLYDMDVYVDPRLAKEPVIDFNACSHRMLIQMSYADFERLENPIMLPEPAKAGK